MSALPPTDLDLVRGLHARDRKTLARVYTDYNTAVYNLCARILDDREEAKDVTQEVFLKALSTPPKATDDVRLRPWLFRVATNACFNVIRARRDRGGGEADLLALVHDPYEQARSAALIESSLAALNERYRAALVLKDLHGLAGGELAETLQLSRPAADVLVHRARAAFRRAFTSLAGEDAAVPANLAVGLPALALPAALQALPASVAQLAAGAGAAASAAPAAVPAAGVLAKLAAALTSKAAVVAAGATIAVGGGVAAVELAGDAGPAPAAPPSTQPAALGVGDAGAHHDPPWDPHDDWEHHRRAARDRARERHGNDHRTHRAADGHTENAAHDGAADDAASHETTTHDAATTSSSSTSTTTSTTHDGGDDTHGDEHE